jgi:hypothetical protein
MLFIEKGMRGHEGLRLDKATFSIYLWGTLGNRILGLRIHRNC